ncbi:MAG: MMPL family transporter [Deinococcales bacterium]
MMRRIARITARYPRWVLAGWLLLAGLSLPFAARVGEVLTAQPGAAPHSVASQVRSILRQRFTLPDDFNVVLVAHGVGDKVGQPAFDSAFTRVIDRIKAVPGVTAVRDYRSVTGLDLVSSDRSYTVALVGMAAPDLGTAKAITNQIRTVLAGEQGLRFTMAGGPATVQELERVSEHDARRAEVFGLPISLLILVIAFGAIVASALPLLVALASITVSLAALYAMGQIVEFAVFTQTVVTMLGLATGIDYALLMVNRFREELRHTFDPREAAERTARTAGKAVAFSGLTVVMALSGLLVPPLTFIRSIGVGTIIRRRNSRSGTPVEGTMEVTEYEHNRKFTTVIHDGPTKMIGGLVLEPVKEDQTKVTTVIDLPDMDESMDTSFLMKRLKEVAQIREKLIEAET